MAFDSTKYKPKQGKSLPVLLLLDQSSSMEGDKIQALNQATEDMIETFAGVSSDEVEILVGIITFDSSATLHTPFTSAKELQRQGHTPLVADGNTAMGEALTLAHEMLDDRAHLPKNIYRPAVVCVSDGQPNDSWEIPLDTFLNQGRSAKCQRFAIGIGADMNLQMLEQFTGNAQNLFQAHDSNALKQHFAFITQTVSQRSSSVSPNSITALSSTSVTTSASVSLPTTNSVSGSMSVPPSVSSQEVTRAEESEDFNDFDDFDEDAL